MLQPETKFTTVGDDRVAYQVMGDGPLDLVFTMGQWAHLDVEWEDPAIARFNRRLASFSRLIRFNARGSGLSDPRPDDGKEHWQHWIEELLAVMAAIGSRSVAILAWADGAQAAIRFASDMAERVRSLVLVGPIARHLAAPDYPEGHSQEAMDRHLAFVRKYYGTERWVQASIPSVDETTRRWCSKWMRATGAPKAVVDGFALQQKVDFRSVLPSVRTPTLVMARRSYPWVPLSQARYVADHIPGARFVEIPGADAAPFWESADLILDQTEEFVTGKRGGAEPDRVLAAVLFTDIVGSTERAAALGDAAWRVLLDRHDKIVRNEIALYGGRFADRTGDGSLSTFENPRRAIDCAFALQNALVKIGIDIRAGVHFGELERRADGTVGGMNVHVGARVMSLGRAGEVLVSRTLRDILIGAPYKFIDQGVHSLKGVPDQWQLYAVQPSSVAPNGGS